MTIPLNPLSSFFLSPRDKTESKSQYSCCFSLSLRAVLARQTLVDSPSTEGLPGSPLDLQNECGQLGVGALLCIPWLCVYTVTVRVHRGCACTPWLCVYTAAVRVHRGCAFLFNCVKSTNSCECQIANINPLSVLCWFGLFFVIWIFFFFLFFLPFIEWSGCVLFMVWFHGKTVWWTAPVSQVQNEHKHTGTVIELRTVSLDIALGSDAGRSTKQLLPTILNCGLCLCR